MSASFLISKTSKRLKTIGVLGTSAWKCMCEYVSDRDWYCTMYDVKERNEETKGFQEK